MTQSFPRLLLLATALLSCLERSQADEYQQRLERSNSYNDRFAGLVDRASVAPRFFGEQEAFAWYRVETGPQASEHVLIDTAAGSRTVLFNSQTIAKELAQQLQRDSVGTDPRLSTLSFSDDRQQVYFRFENQDWQWDRNTNSLSPATEPALASSQREGLTPLDALRPSTGGEPTEIQIRNQTQQALEVFWVDNSGGRRRYGRVAAGETYPHPTFEGHVWLLVDDQGNDIAAFQAEVGTRLAVVDDETPRPRSRRRRGGGGDQPRRQPQFVSPDQKWRVEFDADNIVLVNQSDDSRVQVTSDGNPSNRFSGRVWWSPDGLHFAALRTEVAERRQITLVEAAPHDQLQPRTQTIDYVKPGDTLDHPRLHLFSIADLEQSRDQLPATADRWQVDDSLFPNPFSLQDFEWRNDSREFTFVYNQRGHQTLRVLALDPTTRGVRAVIDETSETFVCYSHKYFFERLEESDEIVWMTERDGWNHLVVIDWSTGNIKHKITSGQWVVRDVERFDRQSRQLWLVVGGINPGEDPYHQHLIRVNLDGSGLTKLTAGDGDHRWRYSPEGRWLIDSYSRVDLPPVNVLRDAQTGEEVCVMEQADWSRLIEAGWRAPERFVAKGRDGETDIYGIIVRPTDFDPEKSYPVLEAMYAGPQSAFTPKSFGLHGGLYSMAEMGYVVVKLDGMGTSYRSKAFHDVCWKNLGDSGFPDRMLWIKAAAESRPEMDLTRVGIWGGSAGGQSSLRAVLAYGDFYHAAAADCGCHDNRMDKIWWNEQWMGWPIDAHYEEQSNVTQAHRLQGKLLLTVGALDSNVDPSSTMQVVEALIKADKDFELIVFPSGGHGSGSSRYGERRMKDFFWRAFGGPRERTQS